MAEVFMDECQKLRTDFDYVYEIPRESSTIVLRQRLFFKFEKLLDELLH